jgi:hypothetical protein
VRTNFSLKNKIKRILGRSPALYFAYSKIAFGREVREECLFKPTTEIVIEGFPRSANTYSVVAFRSAQNSKIEVAHHIHSEAQILAAVKLLKPVVVLIRNPDDAVRSLMIRQSSNCPTDYFERYFDFYNLVSSILDDVVIAQFENVIADFGSIICEVNEKFDMNYRSFISSPENISRVFEEIDGINTRVSKGLTSHVARPDAERMNDTIDLGDSIWRKRANQLYVELTEMTK